MSSSATTVPFSHSVSLTAPIDAGTTYGDGWYGSEAYGQTDAQMTFGEGRFGSGRFGSGRFGGIIRGVSAESITMSVAAFSGEVIA